MMVAIVTDYIRRKRRVSRWNITLPWVLLSNRLMVNGWTAVRYKWPRWRTFGWLFLLSLMVFDILSQVNKSNLEIQGRNSGIHIHWTRRGVSY